MGRPKDTSDREILRAVALTPGPIATAPKLVERLDMGLSGINKRLDELVEAGYLNEEEVGASAVVYWLTEKGEEYAASTPE